ncbi:MAG: class I SAM-dependent methyltransferase [Desulfuromonadaceae bacterium]|nr:class I SAM-dependent methyltransferase [Desulfuromonadaceae bacterium]
MRTMEEQGMKRTTLLFILLLLAIALPAYFRTQKKHSEIIKPDVHYVPTPQNVVDEMLAMARVGSDDILYDLGCGDGRIVITAAKKWGTRGIGIEIDPKLIRLSKGNAAKAKVEDRVTFYEQDLFETDFSEATVVALYLLPELNLRLRRKFLTELRPGSRIVSHSWDMGEWEADDVRLSSPYWLEWFPGESPKRSPLFMWVIPANVSGIWQWQEGNGSQDRKELRITQRFQKAEGVFSGPAGKNLAAVEIAGESVQITIDEVIGEKIQRTIYQGRAEGDVIEGMVTFGHGPKKENRPWRAVRLPGTMTAVDKEKKLPEKEEKKVTP